MKTRVFIDGSEGTTGLRIYERFAGREDIELLPVAPELRKDIGERKRLINSADVVFLCLPDGAAKESAGLVENENVRIIDTSTASGTAEGWIYGFPELSVGQREAIAGGGGSRCRAAMRPVLFRWFTRWLLLKYWQRIIRFRHFPLPGTAEGEEDDRSV